MFKRLFSLSNPLGIAFTAAALILSFSPEARKGTRKLLVKGASALLSVGDQVKVLSSGARKEIGGIFDEAKVEKEHVELPDFSEMIHNTEDSTKTKYNQEFNDVKMSPASRLSHAMELGEEFIAENRTPISKKGKKNKVNKNGSINKNVQNVLSDKAYDSFFGKPPY